MSTRYCGCDPEAEWTCETHRNQGEGGFKHFEQGGFCACTEGGACPDQVTPPPVRTFAPIPGVLLLGIGHKAHHGKDSVAQFMIEHAPADVLRIGFADALYDYSRVVHGMQGKDATLLQKVGAAERVKDPDVWINAVYWKIYDKRPKVVVIPDTRHLNEVAFIRQMGGLTLRVVRAGDSPEGTYQAPDRDPNHVSEVQLADNENWDLTMYNNGTLDQLRDKAIFALGYIRKLATIGRFRG